MKIVHRFGLVLTIGALVLGLAPASAQAWNCDVPAVCAAIYRGCVVVQQKVLHGDPSSCELG
jgi:hypothetical protein